MAGIGPTGLGGIGLGRSASARLALALLLALALVRGLEEARADYGAERGAGPVDGDGRGLRQLTVKQSSAVPTNSTKSFCWSDGAIFAVSAVSGLGTTV